MPAKLAHPRVHASSPKHPTALKAKERRPTSAALTVKNLLGANSTPSVAKKHDDHDAGQLLAEKRLFAARKTKRLDLSRTSSSCGVPSFPIAYQCFPRQVLLHAQMGHHLTELWLTNHHIGTLPPDIGQCCASLRVLGLGGNALTSLPEEVRDLTSLEALYLENNRFQTIPASLGLPPKLRDLRLDGNMLTVFPPPITKLRLLNRLGLSRNQIREVPREIRRLLNLVELDLDYNLIGPEHLPQQEMVVLKKLERLGLEGNRLDERALEFTKRTPALVFLRISGNRSVSKGSEDGGGSVEQYTSDGPSVPVRHDGYFQCTQGYRVRSDTTTDSIVTAAEGADSTLPSTSDRTTGPRLSEGLVPCREQNMVNAEAYRMELANGVLRKGKTMRSQ